MLPCITESDSPGTEDAGVASRSVHRVMGQPGTLSDADFHSAAGIFSKDTAVSEHAHIDTSDDPPLHSSTMFSWLWRVGKRPGS